VDQQGHVYISGSASNDIHRLSPDGTFRSSVVISLTRDPSVFKIKTLSFPPM
jgi:hypothetical protein